MPLRSASNGRAFRRPCAASSAATSTPPAASSEGGTETNPETRENRTQEALNKLRSQSRRFVKRAVFSRLLLIAALVFAQIFLVVFLYRNLGSTETQLVQAITTAVAILLVIFIVNRDIDPAFKLSWIIPMIAVPVVGVPLYFAVRSNFGARKARKRVAEEIRDTKHFIRPDEALGRELAERAPEAAALARYAENVDYSTAYRNVGTVYYPGGEEMFRAMMDAIESAKSFVFLEFFILDKGTMWDELLELLYRKVQEGVEVRLLYDGIGSIFNIPARYERTLTEAGIETRVFCPVRPVFSTEQNNRDHRKIVVIDGTVAFTGGINIADEYINRRERFGRWKDAGVSVKGEAARAFTLLFLQAWNTAGKTRTADNYERYLDVPRDETEPPSGYCIPLADNPMDPEQVIETAYIDVLARARDYVHIVTPYLILDSKLTNALTSAAKRGVDVSIILPHVPDKKAAFAIARSHYPELLSAGVRIYEYTPGFVHAKTFVSDGVKAVVGTSNLDFRSLYLHFECAAYFWDERLAAEVEADFQATAAESHRITMKDYDDLTDWERFSGNFLRLFGTLM